MAFGERVKLGPWIAGEEDVVMMQIGAFGRGGEGVDIGREAARFGCFGWHGLRDSIA